MKRLIPVVCLFSLSIAIDSFSQSPLSANSAVNRVVVDPDAISIEVLETFDYPGDAPNYIRTVGINDRGDVVGTFDGTFNDTLGEFGFVRYRNGRFSPPIEGPKNPAFTFATGINSTPTVCGFSYDDVKSVFTSYFLSGGVRTLYSLEGAASTAIGGINSARHFAGAYGMYGFTDDGCFINADGQITTFNVPEADYHRVTDINSADMVVGWYEVSNNYHGFFFNANSGRLTRLNFPGSRTTVVNGINDNRVMVGWYWGSSSHYFGFVFRPGNTF